MTIPDRGAIIKAMAKALHEKDHCCDEGARCREIEKYYIPLAEAALDAVLPLITDQISKAVLTPIFADDTIARYIAGRIKDMGKQ